MSELNKPWGMGEMMANCFDTIRGNLIEGKASDRDNAFRYEKNEICIDTCIAFDTGYWETGIDDSRYDNSWIIVEEYDSEELAKLGHDSWVGKLTSDNPPETLKDVHTDETFKRN